MEDTFRKLYDFDISPYVQSADFGFGPVDYIEWAVAWKLLRELYPNSTYEIHEFNSTPFLHTPFGVLVKVSVKVQDRTETDWYPVEPAKDGKHTAFDIAVAHQRALVKAIGRHGLGLKLWEKTKRETMKHTTHTNPQETHRDLSETNLEDYIITFGKFKGVAFKDVPDYQLTQYIDWLAKNNPKPPQQNFINLAKAYLSTLFPKASAVNETPQTTDVGDIPF